MSKGKWNRLSRENREDNIPNPLNRSKGSYNLKEVEEYLLEEDSYD